MYLMAWDLYVREANANLNMNVIVVSWTLNLLTCTNSMRRGERSVMKCERSGDDTGTVLKFPVLVTVSMTLPLRLT